MRKDGCENKREDGMRGKEDPLPYTVEQFRRLAQNSVPIFEFPIPFKKVEADYIIYRNQGWQAFPRLHTFICIPGTAYVNHNTLNSDTAFPGLLSLLPPYIQIILLPFPNAPEQKFPVPVMHLQRTLGNLMEKSDSYRIDHERTILGGYSCGGTLTVSLAIHFAKQNLHFRSLLYISPIFDYSGTLAKQDSLTARWGPFQGQDNETLNSRFIDFMNAQFSRNREDLCDARYSPIFTSLEEMALLRRNCFVYGEFDFMRRTIEVFKERLTAAGGMQESLLLTAEGHRALIMLKAKKSVLGTGLQAQLRSSKMEVLRQISACLMRLLR